jgi:hypothetical protein
MNRDDEIRNSGQFPVTHLTAEPRNETKKEKPSEEGFSIR